MNFKQFSASDNQWHDVPYYIHKTDTDTIATLPADVYADGNNATVGLVGNMSQAGTPTPDIPVDVAGCGAKTANLFDIDNVLEDYYLRNGVPTEYHIGGYVLSDYIPIASDTATISAKITISSYFGAHWAVYDENKTFIRGGIAFDANGSGIKVRDVDTSGAAFIRVDYSTQYLTDCMLNLGSTPLPYEPYGYKIPILSADTTTPVYLGEVETTRKIGKLVLTGEEVILRDREREGSWRFFTDKLISAEDSTAICTHFENIGTNGVNNSDNIGFSIFNKAQFGCRCPKSIATTASYFKDYLAVQYAAGTPVTVWYVLAEPETAVVNEPLMKIGDYADIVSDISVPVTAGGDTISVDATVQPSGVAINYKGWHNAKCKEYSYNMTIADWESASISQMENHTIQELQGGNWV